MCLIKGENLLMITQPRSPQAISGERSPGIASSMIFLQILGLALLLFTVAYLTYKTRSKYQYKVLELSEVGSQNPNESIAIEEEKVRLNIRETF